MDPAVAAPRIRPLEPPYEREIETMLQKWMPPGRALEPLILFRTLAVHDQLAARMRPLGAGILGHGRIGPREREIVIHRTCARAGAEYEWGVHAEAFGRVVGLTDQQLAATVNGGAEDSCWSDGDRVLVRLADELYDHCSVGGTLWARLAERYRDDQLLELVITAGWYRLIAGVINAVAMELEPWAARFPA